MSITDIAKKTETKTKKALKLIVYIQEFDKYDSYDMLLCRNTNCNNYPNVITILARFAKESTLILIEESLQDLKNWNVTILYLDPYMNNMDTNMIHLKTKSRLH
jgi:hypothetical protein